MSELPSGWARTTLGTVADWGAGGTPSRSEPKFYGGKIPWIKSGELNSRYIKTTEESITEEAIKSSSAKIFPAGSVAIAMYGATIGKTAILGIDASTNQACAVGVPVDGLIGKEYLYRLLQNEKAAFIEKGKGGAQPNISQAVIKAHEIGLPPLAEQTRIAAKLEELLAQVDTLKARIDGIPALLKRFRQSVLAAAVSGQLTEEWRLKIASADQLDHSAYPEVPLDSLADFQNGFAFKSDWFSKTGDIQVAKIGNVRNGKVDLDNSPAFVSYEVGSEYQRFMTLEGDILLSMTGTKYKRDYGNACSAPAGILVNQRVGKLRPQRDKVDGRFLLLCLQTAGFREQFFSGETGQVSQGNVGSEHIKKCLIPSPPIEEQAEIVYRTAQLFAFAEQVEAKVVLAKSRVDHLAQSILAKAFRGELVPQDPNDEPASVLLERIKAQRAAMPKAKRGRQAAKLS
ncbi:Type I restriction enzyme EcoKI specificity protein [Pseudomonas sp. 34 E 7]|uniref:restriction endonuclease subunit S n=1 Tax=Pseudomonas sp. 34 E 7 TaxID=1844102 RepID=UPI000811E62F|nr:restriction endonuclease subunit S [Pseudomonas sp. 34 E 7]CRN03874.1 Type I restriction enzyme EcoKI specificity protein [Pseudomonas sp. 34 E 7]